MLEIINIQNQVLTHCQQIGVFDNVLTEEPDSLQAGTTTASIVLDSIKPDPKTSGLAQTNAIIVFKIGIWQNSTVHPHFGVPQETMLAAETLIESLHTSLTLNNDVMTVDLFGWSSTGLDVQTGYAPFDEGIYRIVEITVPIIVNDVWTQES